MLDLLIFLGLVVYAIGSAFGIANDFLLHQSINWVLVVIEFIVLLIILKMMGVFERKKTIESKQKKWKFKNYTEVAEYLEKEKHNLHYEPEDKERLVILLFFDWIIVDDSNPDALILERKELHHMKQKIFTPQKKKSL
jgi:hypothetical protein